ncbi:MAG: hypothetical protein Q4G46_04070 [Propionibacteriaceae bacterium]|nr:hypothetical protein [Propionibacteriaceae bacterium]
MTTDSVTLQREIAVALERRNRHLANHRAEGLTGEGVVAVDLLPRRLRKAKKSYNARALAQAVQQNRGEGYHLLQGRGVRPQTGDLVLARVGAIGQHKRLESHTSYRRHLFSGDEIVVVYGNRYAPDQFLAEVPRNLNFTNLVAAGGMAGRVIDKHAAISPATVLEPIGLIADDEGPVNLTRLAPARIRPWQEARAELDALPYRPRIIFVFGSSMNSGKSTTLGCLVNGLTNAGLTVHAGKATGTGAGNDSGLFRDAGADRVLDFTDFGLVSTFQMSFESVKDAVFSVAAELANPEEPGGEAPDAVVVEIADGIYQGETSALVRDPDFRAIVDAVLFACGEALSAAAGSSLLLEAGLPLVAISGLLTASPLIAAEAAAVVDTPIVQTYDLCMAGVASGVAGL